MAFKYQVDTLSAQLIALVTW